MGIPSLFRMNAGPETEKTEKWSPGTALDVGTGKEIMSFMYIEFEMSRGLLAGIPGWTCQFTSCPWAWISEERSEMEI